MDETPTGSHVHTGDGSDHVVDVAKARDVVLPVANAPEYGVEVGAVITREDGKYYLSPDAEYVRLGEAEASL